jgi:ABC-2 type transport system permease protein
MNAAGKVWLVARFNLIGLFRDRMAVFFVIVLPFIAILVGGMLLGEGERLKVSLYTEARGPLAGAFVRQLTENAALDVHEVADMEELHRAVQRQVVLAGVVIPADYDKRLVAGESSVVDLVIDRTRGYPLGVRTTVAGIVAEEAGRLQAATFASGETGADFSKSLAAADRVAVEDQAGVAVEVRSAAGGRNTFAAGYAYSVPGNLVLFMFITTLASAVALQQARARGCITRAVATPTSRVTLVLGECAGRFVIAMFQASVIVVIGTAFFRVEWGNLLAMVVLIVAFAVVSTSAAVLLGVWATTEHQIGAGAPAVGIALGMLGGCMWPLEIVPSSLRMIGHAFPHAWAMDAATAVTAGGVNLAGIAPELAALAAFAVGFGTLAAIRLRSVLA